MENELIKTKKQPSSNYPCLFILITNCKKNCATFKY